jgi:hypothetical protein
MTNDQKIMTAHLQRFAYIYIRQSTAAQVEHNRESTDRQYKLLDRAHGLGWPKDQASRGEPVAAGLVLGACGRIVSSR